MVIKSTRGTMRTRRSPTGPGFGSVVKYSFASGLGFMGSIVVFMFVGMLFLIPGIYLIMREKKKPKEEKSQGALIGGIALVAIGCIIGLGMGTSFLGDGIGQLVE